MRERLWEFIRYRGITEYRFCKLAGVAINFLRWGSSGVSAKSMYKIGQAFPELNLHWVATGEGAMLKGDTETIPLSVHQAIIKEKDEVISTLSTKIQELRSHIAEITLNKIPQT